MMNRYRDLREFAGNIRLPRAAEHKRLRQWP